MKADLNVGDKVRWNDNPYKVVKISGNKVKLRQEFSIGMVLPNEVPIGDVILEKDFKPKGRVWK